MRLGEFEINEPIPALKEDEVLVRVAGCGVCYTDLGFFYEGVRTARPTPLTLGHEISGFVEQTGSKARIEIGRAVVVPVLPCGPWLLEKGSGVSNQVTVIFQALMRDSGSRNPLGFSLTNVVIMAVE